MSNSSAGPSPLDSNSFFRLISDSMNDMVAVIDRDGRRLYNSPSYGDVLDSPEQLAGTDSFEEIHPLDRARVQSIFRETVRTGVGQRADYRFLLPDGSIRYVESQGSTIKDPSGEVSKVVVVSRDITKRREAEFQVRQLNEELEKRVQERTAELEEAIKELESFSYSVSHDLRAPLRSIAGYAKILSDTAADNLDASSRGLLEKIQRNAEQMGTLIRGLLDLSGLGRRPLQKAQVNVRELVAQTVEELREAGDLGKAAITIGPLPTCEADPTLLRQVFANLVQNSAKFSQPRETPTIHISSDTADGNLVFRITDNGVGFPKAYAHKLFGVFERLHNANEFEGTGIGLAIVQRIVTRHGGKIWAHSSEGEGAEFCFTLGQVCPDSSHPTEKLPVE